MRSFRRLAAVLFAAAAGLTCTDASTGPATRAAVTVSLQPQLAPAAAATYSALAQMGITVNNVRVILARADGRVVLDTTVTVGPGQQEVALALAVVAEVADEEFTATLELRNGDTVLFRGTQLVRAGTAPVNVTTSYEGPGASMTRLELSPIDTSISTAAPLALRFRGFDTNGADVPNMLLGWSVDDATLAAVDAAGLLTPTGKRGRVRVIARTANAIADTVHVTLVPPVARVEVLSGADQQGTAGRALGQPVRIEVQAADGVSSPGVPLTMSVISGGGTIAPANGTSDANGRLELQVTPGPVAGSQSFQVRVAGTDISAIFDIQVAQAPASDIAMAGGDAQEAFVGTAATLPLAVSVTNEFGQLVPGAVVHWSVAHGGGSVGAAESASDAAGLARMTYTFGANAGTDTIVATLAATTAEVRFALHGRAGPPASMAAVNGTSFSGIAGTILIAPWPTVQVLDQFGNAMVNVPVTISHVTPNGDVPMALVPTDSVGKSAVADYQLPTTAGTLQLRATVDGIAPVTFTVTVLPSAPDHYAVIASTATPAPGAAIGVSAQLMDVYGNAVPEAARTANWFSTNGGSFSSASSQTDAAGVASVTFTAANASGVAHELHAKDASAATIVGLTRVTTAGGGAHSYAVSASALDPIVGTTITVTAQLLNDGGAPLATAGRAVRWTSTNGGSFASAETLTDAAGLASVTFTVADAAGVTHALLATDAQVSSVQGTRSVTTRAAPVATGAAMVGGDGQQGEVSTDLAAPLAIRVTDDAGQPMAGVQVVWSASSGAGVTTASSVSGADGVAQLVFRLPQVAGAVTISAEVSGIPAVTFNATAVAGARHAIAIVQPPPDTVQNRSPWSPAPSVRIVDVYGNTVAGEGTLIFALPPAGGPTLQGNSASIDSTGVATFSALVADGRAGARFALTFDTPAMPQTISDTVTLVGGSAGFLVTSTSSSPSSGTVITLTAQIVDAAGAPIAESGRPVRWSSTNGGSFSASETPTNSSGAASVTFAVSAQAGVTHTIQATDVLVPSLTGETAVTTRDAPVPTTLTKISGDAQSAVVNTALAEPVVVELRDAQGEVMAGYSISWSSNGGKLGGNSSSAATTTTDALGRAEVSYIVSTVAGSTTITGTAGPGVFAVFTARSVPGAPAHLQLARSPSASTVSGQPFATQPILRVTDQYGNATPDGAGLTIVASVQSTSHTLAGQTAIADSTGHATFASLTPSGPAGPLTIWFGTDAPVTTATSAVEITAALNTLTRRDSTTYSGMAGDYLTGELPAVVVTDGAGAPVSGATVEFSRVVAGTVVHEATVITDSLGQATLGSLLLPTTAGSLQLRATSSNATEQVEFSVEVRPSYLAQLQRVSGDRQAIAGSGALPEPLVVRATDSYGNAIADAPVRWSPYYGTLTVGTSAESVTDSLGFARAPVTLDTVGAAHVRVEAGYIAASIVRPERQAVRMPRLISRTVQTRTGTIRVYDGLSRPTVEQAGVTTQAFESGYAVTMFRALGIPAGVTLAWMGDDEETTGADDWTRASNWRTGGGAVASAAPGASDVVFLSNAWYGVIPRLASNATIGTLVTEYGAELVMEAVRLEITQGGVAPLRQGDYPYFYSTDEGTSGTVAFTTTPDQPIAGYFQHLEVAAAARLTETVTAWGNALVSAPLDVNGHSFFVDRDFSVAGANAALLMHMTGWSYVYVGGHATFDGRDVGTDWVRGDIVLNGDLTVGNTHTPRAFRPRSQLVTHFTGAGVQTVRGGVWRADTTMVGSAFGDVRLSGAGSSLALEVSPAFTGTLWLNASHLVLPAGTGRLVLPAGFHSYAESRISNADSLVMTGTDVTMDAQGPLPPDLVIDGTVRSYSTVVPRDLHVNGEFTLWGTVSVVRDVNVIGSGAVMHMPASNSRLVVDGTAHFDGRPSWVDGSTPLQNGVIELRGDLQVDSTFTGDRGPAFRPQGGNLTVLFNGAGDQQVRGAGIWSVTDPNFNAFQHLQVEKPAGTTLTLGSAGNGWLPNAVDGALMLKSGRLALYDTTKTLFVAGEISSLAGSDMSGIGVLQTSGASGNREWPQMAGTWPGHFWLRNGHTVTLARPEVANGNVWIGGTLNVNAQVLTANADFETVAGTGRLVMRDSLSTVVVNGNAFFSGADAAAQEDFSSGLMRFKGNVGIDIVRTRAVFAASPAARFEFVGEEQELTMGGVPTDPATSRLGTVIIDPRASVLVSNRGYTPFAVHQWGTLVIAEAAVLTIGDPAVQQPVGEIVLYQGSTTQTDGFEPAGYIALYGGCRTEPQFATTLGNWNCGRLGRVVEAAVSREQPVQRRSTSETSRIREPQR